MTAHEKEIIECSVSAVKTCIRDLLRVRSELQEVYDGLARVGLQKPTIARATESILRDTAVLLAAHDDLVRVKNSTDSRGRRTSRGKEIKR